MNAKDPARGTPQELSLRAQLRQQEARRQRQYAEYDRMLAAGRSDLDAKQAALTEQLAENVQAAGDLLAELQAEEKEPAVPPASGREQGGAEQEAQIFDSLEAAAAAGGPFSDRFPGIGTRPT